MKKIKIIYSLALLAGIAACEKKNGVDDDLSFLNTAASSNIDKVIDISNDNSGLVKITPKGEGVSASTINFGHGTGSGASATVFPGGNASHVYPEGNHTVTIVSSDIAGKQTTNTYPVTVTYRAPENIEPAIGSNANSISVKATAKYARSFLVYFGDVANETGTPLAKDGTVYHEYAAAGNYDVKVVAISGNDQFAGAAKADVVKAATMAPFSFRFPISYEEAGVAREQRRVVGKEW